MEEEVSMFDLIKEKYGEKKEEKQVPFYIEYAETLKKFNSVRENISNCKKEIENFKSNIEYTKKLNFDKDVYKIYISDNSTSMYDCVKVMFLENDKDVIWKERNVMYFTNCLKYAKDAIYLNDEDYLQLKAWCGLDIKLNTHFRVFKELYISVLKSYLYKSEARLEKLNDELVSVDENLINLYNNHNFKKED